MDLLCSIQSYLLVGLTGMKVIVLVVQGGFAFSQTARKTQETNH